MYYIYFKVCMYIFCQITFSCINAIHPPRSYHHVTQQPIKSQNVTQQPVKTIVFSQLNTQSMINQFPQPITEQQIRSIRERSPKRQTNFQKETPLNPFIDVLISLSSQFYQGRSIKETHKKSVYNLV